MRRTFHVVETWKSQHSTNIFNTSIRLIGCYEPILYRSELFKRHVRCKKIVMVVALRGIYNHVWPDGEVFSAHTGFTIIFYKRRANANDVLFLPTCAISLVDRYEYPSAVGNTSSIVPLMIRAREGFLLFGLSSKVWNV